jgi:hypothetical protein
MQMNRRVSVAVLVAIALLAVVPLIAQGPKGWLVRADRSTSATDPDAAGSIKFTAAGTGFHAITPQAAVFWNPANTVAGNYSLKGTFTLNRPSSHTNYYGLVFGGSDLGGPRQTYLYFLVAQDGTWLLKRREGDVSTQDVAPRAVNAAVKRPDAKGQSVNALEVQVTADKMQYLVNGTVVHTMPKTGLAAKTDGLYGIRVNHALDVQVDGFALSKP